MVRPTYTIKEAYDNSPKSDATPEELNPTSEKRVFAQNINQTQNELGYFWASAGVKLSKENDNKTATSVANYMFENILEDISDAEAHTNQSDLYVASRINFQQNTKSLSNEESKGVFFFVPSHNNKSSYVSFRIFEKDVYRVYKRGASDQLVELEIDDLKSDHIYMMAFDYKADVPCFVLFDMLTSNKVQKITGKYLVDKELNLVTQENINANISEDVLNIGNGNLSKDKVDEDKNKVVSNAIYTVYKKDVSGVLHYRENKLVPGDMVFCKSNKTFYYFDGVVLTKVGYDGRYVFNAYTDDGLNIYVNSDVSDLVYIDPILGAKNITIVGNPKHMQKLQIFLRIVSLGAIKFTNVGAWLDNAEIAFFEPAVYPMCFVYDAHLQKWIGNPQGLYK